MTWGDFRKLTKDIPDEEEVFFNINSDFGYIGAVVDEEETRANMTNDNTIILNQAS